MVSRNGIGASGANTLGNCLQNCNFHTLNISHNKNGDKGATLFSMGLKHCSNLYSFKHCSNLHLFDISYNNIWNDDFMYRVGYKLLPQYIHACSQDQQ